MSLTVFEKVDAIEASNMLLAWDGCHKMYLLADADDINDAADTGYSVHGASEVRKLIDRSCGLVYIHPWSLGQHEWNIDQGDFWDEGYFTYSVPE